MRTFGLMKGLPIILENSGEQVGVVSDLCIAEDKVQGLLVKRGSFLKQTLFLAIASITSIGPDGIIIPSIESLERSGKERKGYTLSHHSPLAGKMVLSEEGDSLGLLNDVYFLEEVGTIVGYELSDGLFSDLRDGKKIVKPSGPPAIGKDAIIVNPDNV
ncbi:PRC-barrel domain-containing protein [Bacillus sp. FJAT-27445]|uniref:PRC-barrel domain-containing protein n=1 Tax=Bacillus sp. FJAT-27445 TaxID=1679166 RepID=UPI000743B047|nr:PRC-barrel domain-containing protein [Bacillus sp. FJAT-27445]